MANQLTGDSSLVQVERLNDYHKTTTRDYSITCDLNTNIPIFFSLIQPTAHRLAREMMQRDIVKVSLGVKVIFENTEGEEVSIYHNPTFYPLLADNLFEEFYEGAFDRFQAWMDDFQDRGSGMTFVRIERAYLKIVKTKPILGKSYIPLPFLRHSITNIENHDNKCFLWSIIAHYYPQARNKTRPGHYKKYEHQFSHLLRGIQFPVKLSDIPKIQGIAVNVYGLENMNDPSTIYPIQISPSRGANEINLLYLEQGTNTHYCLINDLDSLLSTNRNKHKYYNCRNCLQAFSKRGARDKHQNVCIDNESCRAVLPAPNTTLSFKNPHFCHKLPFVIYADFESISCRINDPNSERLLQQKAISYGVYISSRHEHILQSGYHTYTGYDCMQKFVELMISIYDIVKGARNMRMTDFPIDSFRNTTHCYMCGILLQEKKIAEHCHLTGKYRGASCVSCNVKEGKSGKILPVFFHNGSNYDFHFFIAELMKYTDRGKEKVNVLAKSKEEYISISYGTFYNKLIFLDSYRFLQKSLSDVAKTLDSGSAPQKGIYPYEYVDSLEKLINTTSLPKKEDFYSSLMQEGITEEEYKEAQEVWKREGCRTLLDYHNYYLKSDVMILKEAFEKFRDFFLRYHNIDPCYCYSAPGLTWQCGLRYTDIKLDYITDYDLLLFFEKGVRGGYSGVLGKRHVVANDNLQLLYLDANSLYAWAMSQSLPTGDFRWEDPLHFWNYCSTYGAYPYEEGRGYVFEVDLIHTQESKNRTWKFPLAPENKTTSLHQMSPYQRTIMDEEDIKESKNPRLILDMKDKPGYVIHYKLLQFYLSMGMRIAYIHRIISFKEAPCLKSYINFNTKQRAASNSAFEKDLWKMMSNSFYGKTLENIRNRRNVSLVREEAEVQHHASKGTFVDYDVLSSDLTMISHKKASVKFDKPIYLGMCILDYSKLLMYQFYYNVVQKLWPGNELLYSDCDSLVLSIPTTREQLQNDLLSIKDTALDTSDYPSPGSNIWPDDDDPRYLLHSTKNKKVPGVFKDELNGRRMIEFVALKSKVYSYRVEGKEDVRKAKGICKTTIRKHLLFNDYIQTLYTSEAVRRNNYSLGSKGHQMYLTKTSKKALSAFDSKRWIGSDGIYTEPYI